MKTILIIDDEVDIQAALGFLLKRKGYNVVTASNGLEGLTLLKEGTAPDLILLDGKMPKMNGQEFLKARKEQNICIHVPVFLLSSDLWDLNDPNILKQIPKPFDLNFLLEKIEGVFK